MVRPALEKHSCVRSCPCVRHLLRTAQAISRVKHSRLAELRKWRRLPMCTSPRMGAARADQGQERRQTNNDEQECDLPLTAAAKPSMGTITGDDRFPFFSRRVDRPQGKEHYKSFDKTDDPRGNFKCMDEWGYVDGRSSKVHVAFWHKADDMYFPVHGDLTSENISAQLYIIFGKWKKKMVRTCPLRASRPTAPISPPTCPPSTFAYNPLASSAHVPSLRAGQAEDRRLATRRPPPRCSAHRSCSHPTRSTEHALVF